MRHPGGLGFLVEKPASGPRQQNPHMHLLEAALVNLEASGDERFKALADDNKIPSSKVVEAIAKYGIDPDKADPARA